MYAIIVTASDGTVTPFGPYRSKETGMRARQRMLNPKSETYFPEDEFEVTFPLPLESA